MRLWFPRTALRVAVLAAAWTGTAGAQQTPGFNASALDRSVKPCDDFYQLACGGWLAKNPVPPDRAQWDRFSELAERNQQTLREILEKASAEGARQQQIGDY